jgi:hypothetical protein
MLFPGGAALLAIGWSGGSPPRTLSDPTVSLAEAVFHWLPPSLVAAPLPFDKSFLLQPWVMI